MKIVTIGWIGPGWSRASGEEIAARGCPARLPLQRYDIDSGHVESTVCARADGSGPTRELWRTYLPDVGYRAVCG
ncbi:hypothetical protein [Streptomyces sp. NPDC101234]|uniref:hypothetical protein n=1 Tax=Streptomyces sp. NPDC101234 TaxID=3366138 RepID=UPI0037F1C898